MRRARPVLRREALALGISDAELRRAIASNAIVRLRHGTYALRDHWDSLDARERHVLMARAVLRTARTSLVFSHATAAAVLGLPLWRVPLDQVHATRRDRRGNRREAGVVQHCGSLVDEEVIMVAGLLVTSPARTCLDLGTQPEMSVESLLPLMDDALHRGICTRLDLDDELVRMRSVAGTLANRIAVGLADGRRESVGESRSAYLFWRHHLPRPVPNLEIHDTDGRLLGRVDFAWPELGVFLEFDGRVKYAELLREGENVVDVVLAEKRRQEAIERVTGWRCIRLTWHDLARPHATAAYIKSVLAGGPVHRAS